MFGVAGTNWASIYLRLRQCGRLADGSASIHHLRGCKTMRLFNVRRSTLILTFGILALFVLLNVPGEFVSPGGGSFGPAYPAEYAHGWPWVWLHREVDYQNPIHIPESPLGL